MTKHTSNDADLRALRLWHWRQVTANRLAARMHMVEGNRGLAAARNKTADQHVKFVQILNDFFPVGDNAEGDDRG